MTGPALYHYFATKDALLFACLDQMLDHLLAEVAKAAAGDDAPTHRHGARRARAGGARAQARLGRVAGQCPSVRPAVT
jgi:AcrR family transcriptional regulator